MAFVWGGWLCSRRGNGVVVAGQVVEWWFCDFYRFLSRVGQELCL